MEAIIDAGSAIWRRILDLALPPRCAGCGAIVDELHTFCAPCWGKIEWVGIGGCVMCGIPLEGTDIETCAACLATPPLIDRTRAAVAYGEIARALPLRLKYSRKVALAKTMARYMHPLIEAQREETLLVPVPLHRSRIRSRGFNQSVLLANELSRLCGLSHDPRVLKRIKRTAPLKGMGANRRKKEVSGAFAVTQRSLIEGRTAILIDDVLTTGSTAEACAKALKRAGAERVELICWARVVRPAQIMR